MAAEDISLLAAVMMKHNDGYKLCTPHISKLLPIFFLLPLLLVMSCLHHVFEVIILLQGIYCSSESEQELAAASMLTALPDGTGLCKLLPCRLVIW